MHKMGLHVAAGTWKCGWDAKVRMGDARDGRSVATNPLSVWITVNAIQSQPLHAFLLSDGGEKNTDW